MTKKFAFLVLLALLTSCLSNPEAEDKRNKLEIAEEEAMLQDLNAMEQELADMEEIQDRSTENSQKNDRNLSIEAIYSDEMGWGYQIFENSSLLINQTHIPAIQGLRGFASREYAEKTARYVVDQIANGNFPPTLSQKILDSLGVL